MNISVGIVGLPNVGKSTLFNALLKKQQALAANYPFATIEPNVGIVAVPDERLIKLREIVIGEISSTPVKQANSSLRSSVPIKPATVEFVDIAGLVKGAADGAGLGNKFLSHIKEVNVIAHVVRAFEDPSASSGQAPILREGSVDPKSDYETIQTELILADLSTIQNQQSRMKRFQNQHEKEAITKLFKALNDGKPARDVHLTDEEAAFVNQLFLLSAKPELVVLNVAEEDYTLEKIENINVRYTSILGIGRERSIVVSAKIESELASLSEEEQKEYLKDLGLESSGLERLIQKAYERLGLISFLTAGEKEVKAWTLKKGSNAVLASGEIHTDFMKKFIKAEVVSYNDFVEYGGWKGSREKGKARLEGRDYVIQDGDVIEFKIGS